MARVGYRRVSSWEQRTDRQLEGVELDTGPDYRYDPSVGYRYYQPEEGISESHALFGYLPRQRFLEDWREQHPNP